MAPHDYSKKAQNKEAQGIKEIVIPREDAVFWLDSRGNWRNAGGKFRKKKIIDHFHSSISKDENGYFLYQDKGGVWEKVYFPYEDTALFVFDVIFSQTADEPDITLVLNTGSRLALSPQNLYAVNDCLYLKANHDIIKFTERALIKISDRIDEENGSLYIHAGGARYWVPEM